MDQFQKLLGEVKKEGELGCRVMSGSMEPVLMTGESIRVMPCDFSKLKRFDILIFLKNGYLICHCFWSKNHLLDVGGEVSLNTFPIVELGRSFDFPVLVSEVLGTVINRPIPLRLRLRVYWNRLRS